MLPQGTVWENPFTEMLTTGDINTYGPRGSNAFSFSTFENVPEQYLTGLLAQSWEIQTAPLQMTFHLRPGIMFTGNTKINMAAREVVASDVAFSFNRIKTTTGPARFFGFINTITATDKYTVVLALASFSANWNFYFGGGMAMGGIQPKEMADANNPTENWRNSVGSGPFTLTDYVTGAGATYTRNPNYWGKTTINGKDYQLPFIQTLQYPIISDESTQIAAVRVGKVDWAPQVKMIYSQTLKDTSPKLIQDKYLGGLIDMYKVNRLASKTLNSVAVRQALMVGTDFQNISNLLYNGGPIVSWPLGPQVPGYTKLADLPAADQALFSNNPTLAKQMLATAGYPNGFTVQIMTDALSNHPDLASAVAAQWAKIGVTVNINVVDPTVMTTASNSASYPDLLYSSFTVVNPLTTLNLVDGTRIGPTYLTTEPFQAMFTAMTTDTNAVSRTAKIKDLAVAFLNDVGAIPFAQPYKLNCHWPWMKNYYGELDAGYYNQMPMIKEIWIDPSLK
jgi:peptide/nickel transport system substrate-binding protein